MASELKAALELAGKILSVGEGLFGADQAWTEYKFAVEQFRSIVKDWKVVIEAHNLGDHPHLQERFGAAQRALNDDCEKFSKMHAEAGRSGPYLGQAKAYAFPKTIQRRIQFIKEVTKGIEDAVAGAKDRRKKAEELQDMIGLARSDKPVPDSRFVPLRNYQAQVYKALKDTSESSCPVVFLHGEQGIGKSTLAWHIASEASTGNRSSEELGGALDFRLVILITCSTKTEAESVFEELKGRLGLKGEASDADLHDELRKAKMLVILDDVQFPDIPARIIQLGGHFKQSAKFLITSNLDTLCEDCDHNMVKSIHLQQIDRRDAWKILANHTNLRLEESGPFTQELKGIVAIIDRVVRRTKGHPLALACFASQIRKKRVQDVHEWENALSNFDAAMSNDKIAKMYQGYPRSFSAMMHLSLKDLGEDARKLLLLFLTLEWEPMLEQVIELLYIRLGLGGRDQFRRATDLLMERHLISIRTDEDVIRLGEMNFNWSRLEHSPVHTMVFYTWYIHPLRRKLVFTNGIPVETKTQSSSNQPQRTVKNDGSFTKVDDMKNFIKTRLVAVGGVTRDTNEEDALLTLICDCFLPGDFVPRDLVAYDRDSNGVVDLRVFLMRLTIPPALLLLGLPFGDSWTQKLYHSTVKVILYYSVRKEFGVQDILPLFRSDIAFAAMLHLFSGLWPCGDTLLLQECIIHFLLETLDEVCMSTQQKAIHKITRVLEIYSELIYLSPYMIQSYPLIMERISRVLRSSDNVGLAKACFSFLSAVSASVIGSMSIIHCPGIVSSMLDLVDKGTDHEAAPAIVTILSNVVTIEGGCNLVCQEEKQVANLVEEWCKRKGGARIPLEHETYLLLTNLAKHARGARVIRRYLGDLMEGLQRLLSRVSHEQTPTQARDGESFCPMESRINECIFILCNLAALSEDWCVFVMHADTLGRISTLGEQGAACSLIKEFPVQHMSPASIMLWITLIANLSKHGRSRRQLQESSAVLHLVRQACEIRGEIPWMDLDMAAGKWPFERVRHGLADGFKVDFKWDLQWNWRATTIFKVLVQIGRSDQWKGQHIWTRAFSEVLTCLDLKDLEEIWSKRFEQNPTAQAMVYLARAGAKIILGKLSEAAEDVKEAFIKMRSQSQSQPFDSVRAEVNLRIEEHILRRQCYLMAASEEWEKALQKATELEMLFSPTEIRNRFIDRGVAPKRFRKNALVGLIQRGIIFRIKGEPNKALATFSSGLEVELKKLTRENFTTIWKMYKERAEVYHVLGNDEAAKDDLLAGARFVFGLEPGPEHPEARPEDVFGFKPFPYFLDHMPHSSFIGDFLNSDEFYEAVIVNEFWNSENLAKRFRS